MKSQENLSKPNTVTENDERKLSATLKDQQTTYTLAISCIKHLNNIFSILEVIKALENISAINEATSINADSDDVIYKLGSLFNAEM